MYKCPLAGGCLIEVKSGGSCLCMVNREHFLKSDGGWCEGEGEYWTAVAIPTSLCWLRANARSSLCIYFSSTFQHCVHLLFEAAQSHIWCDRCVQHMSSRGQQQECLSRWIPPFVKVQGPVWWKEDGTKLYSYPQQKTVTPRCLLQFLNFVCLFIEEQYDFSIEDIYTFKQQTIRGRWLLPPPLPTGN